MLYTKTSRNSFLAVESPNLAKVSNLVLEKDGLTFWKSGSRAVYLAEISDNLVSSLCTLSCCFGIGDSFKEAFESLIIAKYASKKKWVVKGSTATYNSLAKTADEVPAASQTPTTVVDVKVTVAKVGRFSLFGYIKVIMTSAGQKQETKNYAWRAETESVTAPVLINTDEARVGLEQLSTLQEETINQVLSYAEDKIRVFVEKYLKKPTEGQEALLVKPFDFLFRVRPNLTTQIIPLDFFETIANRQGIDPALLEKILTVQHGAVSGYTWELRPESEEILIEKIASNEADFQIYSSKETPQAAIFVGSSWLDDVRALFNVVSINHSFNGQDILIKESDLKRAIGLLKNEGISLYREGVTSYNVAPYRLPDKMSSELFKEHGSAMHDKLEAYGKSLDDSKSIEKKGLFDFWRNQDGYKVSLGDDRLALVGPDTVHEYHPRIEKEGWTEGTTIPCWITEIDPHTMFKEDMRQIREYPYMSPSSRGLDVYVGKESPNEKADQAKWSSKEDEHSYPLYDYRLNREVPSPDMNSWPTVDNRLDDGSPWFQWKSSPSSDVTNMFVDVVKGLKEGTLKEVTAGILPSVTPKVTSNPTTQPGGGSRGQRSTRPTK